MDLDDMLQAFSQDHPLRHDKPRSRDAHYSEVLSPKYPQPSRVCGREPQIGDDRQAKTTQTRAEVQITE